MRHPSSRVVRAFKQFWPLTDRIELVFWREARDLLKLFWLHADRAWRTRRMEVARWEELALAQRHFVRPYAAPRQSGWFRRARSARAA